MGGMFWSGKVLNKGKRTQAGTLDQVGVLPHRYPHCCSGAWEGAILFYRMTCLNECIRIDNTSIFYNSYLCRSANSYCKPESYTRQYENYCRIFEILGFQSSVKTHYGRHFLSKEMGNDGIDGERRKIFMRRQVGAEAQNYMIEPTDDCLVSGAHGDPSSKTAIKNFFVDRMVAGSDRGRDNDWWINFQRKWLPEIMEVGIFFYFFGFNIWLTGSIHFLFFRNEILC